MIKAAIIGSTGYAGLQLVNLLKNHPHVQITDLLSKDVEVYSDAFPSHLGIEDRLCEEMDMDKLSKKCDVVFMALPHGIASKTVTSEVLDRTKIIDFGADFRLKDVNVYTQWYGVTHFGQDLLDESVYGLCEWNREKIKDARLIANPGCYTTTSILSLLPVVKNDLIDVSSIIVDAKSGVSGAGRSLSLGVHMCECNESVKAYGVGTHRHTPEIEQELSAYSEKDIKITFTPHLVPMNRGILAVSYATIKNGVSQKEISESFKQYYENEYFIRIRDAKNLPQTNYVKGSNYFDVGYVIDERTNRLIIIGALDNLMKGASSQAVQNMNILFGIDEKIGIDMCPMYI